MNSGPCHVPAARIGLRAMPLETLSRRRAPEWRPAAMHRVVPPIRMHVRWTAMLVIHVHDLDVAMGPIEMTEEKAR